MRHNCKQVAFMPRKRKKGRPRKWREPVGTTQLNIRFDSIIKAVFDELCRRRGLTKREGMERALSKWAGLPETVSHGEETEIELGDLF
jgi:hypothetical protein